MPRFNGGSKSCLQTSLCLFSSLIFLIFFLILLNLPVLPHCFPLLPFGCGALLALEACSDTWLLAAWGLAEAGSVQLSDRDWEESRDHGGGQSHPLWLSRLCWWPLAPLLACWWFLSPTFLWLCLQLRPRPFLVLLRICRVEKHRSVQHHSGAGNTFRTRHCHLWLPFSAESCSQAGQFWQSKAANSREQSQARGGLDVSLPHCPRSGSRLNSHSRLKCLSAFKKRDGYILPAASNVQNSLKKLD